MASSTPGAAVSSGIGHGAAQVFSTGPLIEALQYKREENKKRKQLLDKELQDSLSEIDTTGIREADMDKVVGGYNELVDFYSDIMATEDSTDRIKKQAEFNKRKSQLMGIVKKSVDLKGFEKDLAKTGMNTPVNRLSDSFSETYKKLIKTPVTDDSIVELTDFSRYQKKPEPIDIGKQFDDIAESSTKAFKKDFKGAGFGLVEREEGSKVSFDLFRQNFYQKAIENDDFRDQVEDAYQTEFMNRTSADKLRESAQAESMGIDDYDPNSIDDFIVLQNFVPRYESDEFNKSESTVRTIPKSGSSGTAGSIEFSYKPIDTKPTTTINVNDGGKEEVIPVAKSTPYTKSFNVNAGSGNNSYWDVEEGGWKSVDAGAYRFQSAQIVDVPFAVSKDGKERLIRESLIGKFESGEAQKNDSNLAEAYYRPMIVGTLDVPLGGETIKKQVMIPLEQFPTNTRLSKTDAKVLQMHANGGGQIKVSKDAIKKSSQEPVEETVQETTKEKIDW